MVLGKMLRKIAGYSTLMLLTMIFSCDENPIIIDCNECYDTEPVYATLVLKLDKYLNGGLSPSAVIRIYEGRLEDNIILNTIYIPGNKWEVNVSLNKKYTVTATYTDSRGYQYVAVDTAYPRIRYDKSQCNDPCYFVYDRHLNLTIKYKR